MRRKTNAQKKQADAAQAGAAVRTAQSVQSDRSVQPAAMMPYGSNPRSTPQQSSRPRRIINAKVGPQAVKKAATVTMPTAAKKTAATKTAAATPAATPDPAALLAAQRAAEKAAFEGTRPSYSSRYQDEIDDLLDDILDREDFSYDFSDDPLYRQYRQQYTQQGRQAMADATAQAAALTGGYGNSYAASAGSQAYQQYLGQLDQVIPELYDAAYQRYADEGTSLQNRLAGLQNAENAAYNRYRQQMEDWENEYKRRFG